MIIRCWGARGSSPVSGREYLKYGGDTTCLELRTKNDDVVIVDAGSGLRRLGNSLLREGKRRYTMIFTHAHWDHLMGFPFFKPIYFPKTHMRIYGCPFALASIRDVISRVMAPPNFPVNFHDIRAELKFDDYCDDGFSVHGLNVTPINLSHPNQGIGYKFEEDGRSFVFLTDNELTYRHEGGRDFRDYLEFSRDADLLIHDAEYNEVEYRKTRGWGHSVYRDTLRMALEANVRQLGLFHHNQDRSDDEIDEIVSSCRGTIAQQGSRMECFALTQNTEIRL
ncbi:MAG: ribonuclease Z [Syntrophaceae bacterium PtaU1.Bin231]|nr:MAG: ribonuclease Z [Syntrophaceae bacterium PtaU1.Bin231]HOG17363.1 MBL fold metallo-hydrolase [Syntrophales bacterium]